MQKTPEEIDDEFINRLKPEWQPIVRAVTNFKKGIENDEFCYFCGSKIIVIPKDITEKFPKSYTFSCKCGKSKGITMS